MDVARRQALQWAVDMVSYSSESTAPQIVEMAQAFYEFLVKEDDATPAT